MNIISQEECLVMALPQPHGDFHLKRHRHAHHAELCSTKRTSEGLSEGRGADADDRPPVIRQYLNLVPHEYLRGEARRSFMGDGHSCFTITQTGQPSMLSLSLLYSPLAAPCRDTPREPPDRMTTYHPPLLAAQKAVKMHSSHGVGFEC